MFMFVDGRPVVLSFALVESLYYKAFMERFPEAGVSITQWRGSYEYQAIYPDIQMIVETGVITRDAMAFIGNSIVQANEAIKRPACLYSRVPERFKELGYEATIRIADATNKGEVAICVDQQRADIRRVMTVGIHPTQQDRRGYNSDVGAECGDLDNKDYRGSYISSFIVNADSLVATDGEAVDIILSLPFADDSVSVIEGDTGDVFRFDYFFLQSDSDSSIKRFRIIDAALRAKIKAIPEGGLYRFAFADEIGAVNGDDELIGNLIRDEMLPAGQFMVGDVIYPTALSNGQPIDIKWTTPTDYTHNYRVTIARKRGSPHPENTVDQIIELFNANFDEQMGIGTDITPNTYLTVRDLPWASSVLVEWQNGVGAWSNDDAPAAYKDRFLAVLPPSNVVIQ